MRRRATCRGRSPSAWIGWFLGCRSPLQAVVTTGCGVNPTRPRNAAKCCRHGENLSPGDEIYVLNEMLRLRWTELRQAASNIHAALVLVSGVFLFLVCLSTVRRAALAATGTATASGGAPDLSPGDVGEVERGPCSFDPRQPGLGSEPHGLSVCSRTGNPRSAFNARESTASVVELVACRSVRIKSAVSPLMSIETARRFARYSFWRSAPERAGRDPTVRSLGSFVTG